MSAPTFHDSGAVDLQSRDVPPRVAHQLEQAGLPPLLARLYAARGVRDPIELDDALAHLLPPDSMLNATAAARLLADALQQDLSLCIVADYDCDGATACAVALRGLRMLGARPERLHHVVPDRSVHGYGLTPAIVDLARARQPDLLITVDNGIASLSGVDHARQLGLSVLVTDHHLPGETLPEANVIVNPNQPGCGFASKHLAGVGVMFYVLLALRSELRARGVFDQRNQPRLDALLDLVALGTVADVVRLDANNRRLVSQGLRRIRSGRMQPGVAALFEVAGRDPAQATAQDFGFALGPRINAAGRLSDMTLGIECLITDDATRARELAAQLDGINRERRTVEDGMREQAQRLLQALEPPTAREGGPHEAAVSPAGAPSGSPPAALALHHPSFHEGVVGIVAGRLKERLHRPVFVFATGQDGLLKGSGRSIEGFHLRDALDLISKRHPDILVRFGGHAMAAGCTLQPMALDTFRTALEGVAGEWLDPSTLARRLRTDGALPADGWRVEVAELLQSQVWGQGFEAPLFCEPVEVLQQRVVGEKHLKLRVRPVQTPAGPVRDAIWFNRVDPVPDSVRLAFRLDVNEWQGRREVQMVVVACG